MIPAERELLVGTLIAHQRRDDLRCACGWGWAHEHWGASHAEHVADEYADALAELGPVHPVERLDGDPDVTRWQLIYDGPASRVVHQPAYTARVGTRDAVRMARGDTLAAVLAQLVGD